MDIYTIMTLLTEILLTILSFFRIGSDEFTFCKPVIFSLTESEGWIIMYAIVTSSTGPFTPLKDLTVWKAKFLTLDFCVNWTMIHDVSAINSLVDFFIPKPEIRVIFADSMNRCNIDYVRITSSFWF